MQISVAGNIGSGKTTLTSLLAKHYGARQAILHITTTNYLKSVRRIGADAIVNVRLTTSMVMQGASEILAYGTAVKFK